jgi:probable O-glycosylation ligase (exosortase A-associated)
MLRLLFILIIVVVGTFYALMSPFYGLLFYLWNAYFRPEEWLWWIDVKILHLSWLIGIYVVGRTLLSVPDPKLNLRTALLFLFLVQAAIGTITSEHPLLSWSYLQDFVKVIIISYLIVVHVTDRARFRLTLIVIGLSLGFECAKQGWASTILAPGMKNDNTIAFLGDNNGVALGTMMLVPILGALAQTGTKWWEKYLFRFLAIGVFLRGLTTYSRGGFLAAAVLATFVLIRSEKRFRALIGILLVAGLVWSVMPETYWNRINTITASDEDRDTSAAGRLHFWGVGITMAKSKPLTGVGLNGYSASYATYDPNSSWGDYRAAHSTWVAVAAELGVPGLLIFLANFFYAIASCWQIARRSLIEPNQREFRIYANALLTSLVVFAVAGSFLSSQYSEMLWHFMALSTALSLVAYSESTAEEPAPAVRERPVHPYAVAR